MSSHVLAMRDSQSYEKISTWASNAVGDLTRAPMFGKSLLLDNDTNYSRWKVMCHKKWVRT
jgi:hypothetical protein